ncbi:MAG TPA: SIMPL domain-containing protein [Clostridia bacterium]|nr:SIMPL domain-containing protein [Clostridia bacterium]
MKRSLLFLAVVFLSSLTLLAQTAPYPWTSPRDNITVSSDGKFEADPDTAVIQFNIAAQENELKAAHERAARAAEEIRQTLRANGIDPKQAQIGSFQVEPVYDYRQPKRKLVGYRVNSSVTLKLKDFAKVAPIATAFGQMDVTGTQNISYILDNIDAAKTRAIQDAFRRARGNAETVATASGRQLGLLAKATVDTFDQPPPMPMMMKTMRAEAADAPAPTQDFSPEKITITARVTAEFLLK